MINNLRYLVDIQQFEQLNKKAKEFYDETQDISLLPLLALSYIHQKECKKHLSIVNFVKHKKKS